MFSDLYIKLIEGKTVLSLVGLGYVGMPIAVAFAKKVKVIGFDLNAEKIYKFNCYDGFRRFVAWGELEFCVVGNFTWSSPMYK